MRDPAWTSALSTKTQNVNMADRMVGAVTKLSFFAVQVDPPAAGKATRKKTDPLIKNFDFYPPEGHTVVEITDPVVDPASNKD